MMPTQKKETPISKERIHHKIAPSFPMPLNNPRPATIPDMEIPAVAAKWLSSIPPNAGPMMP
jgi:hypothetical protein